MSEASILSKPELAQWTVDHPEGWYDAALTNDGQEHHSRRPGGGGPNKGVRVREQLQIRKETAEDGRAVY